MTAEARALALVEAALDIADPVARDRFVRDQCGADEVLCARVLHLLAQEGKAAALYTGSVARTLGIDDAPPERIGPFRVTGEIARGGMGLVVRAERDDGLFQQTVAIKLIRGDIASERALARFAEERRILGRLRHPGIVRILDGGEHDNRPWLAMDFVDGAPITTALDAAGAGPAARLDAFERVCEAVIHAHRMLVVHADIKPGNILMTADGGVHLLDFGISRLMVELAREAPGDPYPLTRGYAAPERAVGVAPTVGSDVFSLGMLLVELLTGTLPPTDAPRVAGSALPAGRLRGDLAAIAARALALKPEDRYPDAVSLLSDLRRHRAHVPVKARGDAGGRYVAGRFVLRHRRGLALTGALVAILGATTVISTLSYWRAEQARAEADARFADARGTGRYLIQRLLPRLETLPRALPLRAEAADVAQHYLNRLAGARQASDAVRIEAAEGLLALALQQGRATRPNLAQPAKADANLRKAEAILRALPGAAARRLRARVMLERVRLAAWMQADEAGAEALSRAASASVAAAGGDRALRLEEAMVLAELRGWQGRFAEQAALADRALGWLGSPAGRERQLDRLRMLELKAEAIYYQGRPVAALAVYRDQLALADALRRRWPLDNAILTRALLAAWDCGTTLLDLKRHAEALPYLARAERDAVAALAFDPADAEARRRLRVTRNSYAQALGLLGRTDEALARLGDVRADDAGLLGADPSPRHARDLVFDHTLIGEALNAGGRRAEACAADRRALDLYADLGRRKLLMGVDTVGNMRLLEERIARNCPPAPR